MLCAWQEFLNVVPPRMRWEVDRLGKTGLQELRLRRGHPPELVFQNGSNWLEGNITGEDLSFVVNTASQYSPWASTTASHGYLTAPGGHRIGLCGEVVLQEGQANGLRRVDSVCMRVARDFPGISGGLTLTGSVLIIGSPGAGKTTLLRDLIRRRSDAGTRSIAVVDERGELFPSNIFQPGKRTDILTGCFKPQGIEMVLRTMGPGTIAVDEITADTDCEALLHAGWCGVGLLATAHAASRTDLETRPVYRKIIDHKLFDMLVILQQDKSWKMERM